MEHWVEAVKINYSINSHMIKMTRGFHSNLPPCFHSPDVLGHLDKFQISYLPLLEDHLATLETSQNLYYYLEPYFSLKQVAVRPTVKVTGALI